VNSYYQSNLNAVKEGLEDDKEVTIAPRSIAGPDRHLQWIFFRRFTGKILSVEISIVEQASIIQGAGCSMASLIMAAATL